ncbi:sensor histidine kinase [Anaerotignum propionicum]|uniref:histidine kinase n=1 Tax=Anaerotignum propionicum DSM 1682 TaxID=991789 RepID=A0A0X1U736_ANAPI|nr:sensor histidine kinase [Anaerotignum propionicum]AMJ40750.1 sensor histidine kinase GraS [Anaerotignum propionicum DSM 1682]SHF08814.1 Signal transduction histidine kinase [[Clostridium] propionicum DSM 1682] [Anaerotignum propionicum DSM 1682]
MEHLSIGKLFAKWFMDRVIYFGLYLVFAAVFIITALQYRIDIEPILYSLLICTFLGCCCLVSNFIQYKNKYHALYETYLNLETTISSIPKPANNIEELYGELLRDLFDNRSDLYLKMKKQEVESKDYYTIWIHQIKTPIAALYLLLQVEDSQKNRMLMKQELFKVEQYAEMALYYLRLQHMSYDILLKECNLYEIVKQSVKKYSISFIGKKISLHLEAFDGVVISDEKWLGFVIEQILSNCIKYTAKGSISIEYIDSTHTTQFNDKLKHAYGVTSADSVLCISDTGIGIKEEDLPRIFEKGFTGYNGRMDKKSTGIGLYLCKQVLNKLGFDISVTSEVGKGTMFQIYFGKQDSKTKVQELD